MPHDILGEICSHLDPLTLLHMSRTSKNTRALLISRSAKSIWISARRNVDLPKVGGRHGRGVCGKGRAVLVDYILRVRWCKPCRELNLLFEKNLLVQTGPLHHKTLACCPSTRTSGAGTYTTNLLSYFKPIVESVNARLLELWATHQTANASLDSAGERKETDYERFVSFRMPEAFSAMRKSDADAILEWERIERERRSDIASDVVLRRRCAIEEKLYALGWGFVDIYVLRFKSTLFNQPTELTDKVWEKIKPTILAEIQHFQELRDQWELEERQQARAPLVKPYLIASTILSPTTSSDVFPTFKDFLDFEAVKPVWELDEATIDHEASFGGMDQVAVEAELETYQRTIILAYFRHLATALDQASTPLPASLLAKLDGPLDSPPSSPPPLPTITDAEMRPYFSLFTSRFFCEQCMHEREPLHIFPDIFDHLQTSHEQPFGLLPGDNVATIPRNWISAMNQFFETAGIDEAGRTDEKLEEMGAGFACVDCFLDKDGHGLAKPGKPRVPVVELKWSQMIKHVYRHHFRRYEPPCKGIQYTVPFGHAAHMRQRAKFNKQPVKDL